MVALHECMNICEESPPLSFRRLCVADREKAVQEPFQRCTYIFHTKGVREWKHIVVRQGEVMARVQLLLKSVTYCQKPPANLSLFDIHTLAIDNLKVKYSNYGKIFCIYI